MALLRVVSGEGGASEEVRLAGALAFKNLVKRRWVAIEADLGQAADAGIDEAEKA